MNSEPAVSVIINCYNGEAFLKEAIESVVTQTFPNWEIVFWDNGSTDGSAKIARSYDRVRYFRSDSNENLGAARNHAINRARGKYIAFLDCDDVWLPSKLEKQVEWMERDPGVGLTYTEAHILTPDGRSEPFSTRYPPCDGDAFLPLLTRSDFVVCSSLMVQSRLVSQVGGFDPGYRSAEDLDFLLKIARLTRFGYLSEALTVYRHHDGNFHKQFAEIGVRESIEVTKRYSRDLKDIRTKLAVRARLFLLQVKLYVLVPLRRWRAHAS